MYWRESNPIKPEALAFRGIYDADGTIGAALGVGNSPGQWIGTKAVALDSNYVSGPNNYQPGFNFTVGYRFEDGVALDMHWIHLVDARYTATAGLTPATPIGVAAENTFVSSPVYNFPPSYFGPGNTAYNAAGNLVGSPIAMFGLWDGDSLQSIVFVQRFDQWELTGRIPICDMESWRSYALVGPRITSMWERFTWIVVHPEGDGNVLPNDSATYTNVVSNRLYGVHAGIGNEWYLGDTRCGSFSISLDLQGALFMDFIKGRPKYELGDRSTATQRGRNLFSMVPEADGQFELWWYPYKGIVCRIGYEAMAFYNTYASPQPVDFNFGTITPAYQPVFRLFDGFNLGVGFMF